MSSIIRYFKYADQRIRQYVTFTLPGSLKKDPSRKKIKAGLIGCGHIVKNLYIQALNNKNINLACKSLLSSNPADAAYVRKSLAYKADCYDDYESFARSGIDSLIITTPNYQHYDYIIKGIENNFHIFCEKPLTLDLPEALHVKKLLVEHPVTVMTGFQLRYSDIFNKMELLLKHGEMGGIEKIEVSHFIGIVDHIKSSAWLTDKKKSGGGVLFNAGIHSINLLSALLGELSAVSAQLENVALPITYGEDTASCRLETKEGTPCHLKLSYLNDPDSCKRFSMKIHCDKGTIFCDFHNRQILLTGETGTRKSFFFNELEHDYIYNELGHFIDCITTRTTPETDIDDSIKTLAVIRKLYEAGENYSGSG